LEVVRAEFEGNRMLPTLLLNAHAPDAPVNAESLTLARSAHEQFLRYAAWAKLRVFEVATPADAVTALESLSGRC
jgi:hypothetical protein